MRALLSIIGVSLKMFSRSFLIDVRKKALRRGIWFRALNGFDRAFIDLTIHVVEKIRSVDLGKEIVKVLKKLNDALKSPFVRLMETYGLKQARKLSDQALSWGYSEAERWAHNISFIKYLAVIEINNPMKFDQKLIRINSITLL